MSYADRVYGATAATFADGGTITHGLGRTPRWVHLTASVAGTMLAVTAVSTTTITVAVKKASTTAGSITAGTAQIVYWEVGF